MESERRRIVFLCTGNSCRSQMAEALCREMLGSTCEVFSAGTSPTGYVHPQAIAAMAECGIDICGSQSKSVDDLPCEDFDVVVTVCDDACRVSADRPLAKRRVHWSIADPARASGTRTEIERAFRMARDEIRERIERELK